MAAFIPNVDLTVIKKFLGGVEGPGSFVVSDTISPILEIQDIALFQRREIVSGGGTASAVNITISQTVPAGQFWLVHYISSATDALDADQSITIQLFVRSVGLSTFSRILVPVTIGNSEAGGIGGAFGRPLILPSGFIFGLAVNAITVGAAGSVRIDFQAHISRVIT